jgi:hypothetical protein
VNETDRFRFNRSVEGGPDRLQDAVNVLVEIGIPEPHNAITLCFEPRLPLPVAGRDVAARMLAAVKLDNKSSRQTGKVGDVRSDGNLAPEV